MKLSKEIKEELRGFLKKRDLQHEIKAQIIAPYQLSESEVHSIQSKIPIMKGLSTEVIVDGTLLAGFVVRVGSKMMDYSLRSKVNSLFM